MPGFFRPLSTSPYVFDSWIWKIKSFGLLWSSNFLDFYTGGAMQTVQQQTSPHGNFCANQDRTKPILGQLIFVRLVRYLEIYWTSLLKLDSWVGSTHVFMAYDGIMPRPIPIINNCLSKLMWRWKNLTPTYYSFKESLKDQSIQWIAESSQCIPP